MSRRFPLALLALLALATPVRAEDGADHRLGRDVRPVFEAVRLHVDPDQHDYSGTVRVDLDVTKPVTSFDLYADVQTLSRVVVIQGRDTLGAEQEPDENGLLTLTVPRALAVGPARLEIDFKNSYGTRAVSLYRVTKDGRGYVFTQFESDDARRAFPCWDEPGFKIPWQVTLELPAADAGVSNTPIESERTAGAWKTIVFKRTRPLPSYLLAVCAGPFEFTPVAGTKVPTRIVTVQGQKRLTAVAAADTPKLLAALEKWFGTPYPYEKLDLIAVPDFAYGAMENAGAITYRDDALLMDPATATVSQRRSLANTNCHELSHMWFGDLVTMEWWDDLWLNESFADWMAAKITDEVFPELQHGLNDLQRIQRVKSGDALPSTIPIRSHTSNSSLGLQNVGLVYSKGNAVLSMFEAWLGPEVFRKGVRQYLAEHAWGNATAADLWKALDTASGTNVSAAMSTFVDQPGVPMLRVVPTPTGVRVTQQRCSPAGVSQPPLTWRIPVGLLWSDGRATRTTRVLLAQESQEFPLPSGAPAWVMPNAGGRGYYAWSVPDTMLARIAERAPQTLAPAERVAFLGNLDLLTDAGVVEGATTFDALEHFGGDPSPQVVAAVMGQLEGLRAAFVPDSLQAPFAAYVRRTLGPSMERFGYERRPGEDETIGTVRGELLRWLARWGDDPKAQAFAIEAARRYLADSSSVDPGIVGTVLGLAARRGDDALLEQFRHRFESSQVPATRRMFLGAMGAIGDTTLLQRTLDYSLSDAVRPSETGLVWMGMRDRSESDGAWFFRWITTHYDQVAAHLPPPALRFLPMMGSGCSEERLQAAKAFFGDPMRGIPGVQQTLERVSDGVHQCISLREREGAGVARFLRARAAN